MKVLVTRTDRLGDLVLSLPVLAFLKESQPSWDIQVMVAPAAVAVVENDPNVSRVWTWRDDLNDAERTVLLGDLRAENFEATVMLQYRRELAGLLRKAGIGQRYGPWSKWSSWFQLNRGLRQNRSAAGQHEMDLNLELARHFVRDTGTVLHAARSSQPHLRLAADQHRVTGGFRGEFAVGESKVIFLHPGSGGSALDWEPARFAAVANALAAEQGQRVFVTGSATDALIVKEVARHLAPQVEVLLGRYLLREFLAVLAAGDLFIGPSTGPLHLAAALAVPTVGLFPPVRTMHPDRWGPRGVEAEHRLNLVPDLVCPARHNCRAQRCVHYNCMAEIRVDAVLAASHELLSRAGS